MDEEETYASGNETHHQKELVALDVMIMKKAESNGIRRTVVLFDSEVNHGNKWIGKFAMNTAVNQGNIATEQYS